MSSKLDLESIITKSINHHIEMIMDEEIELATNAITRRIKAKLGSIATEVFNHVEFSTNTNRLVITVRNDI